MSVEEQFQAAAVVEGRSRRRFGTPALDAYEVRRLVLICGCIAAAAAANFAGGALPQRAPVAVGAALLGALLVLRRRRVEDPQEADSDTGAVEVPAVERRSGRFRRARIAQPTAADAWLADLRSQLDGHEQRLTSLSGRQTLIDVRVREQLADSLHRIEELEADLRRVAGLCDRMRSEQSAALQRLTEVFVEHQQAITHLAATHSDTERRPV